MEREYLKPYLVWSSHSMKINDLYVSPTSDRVVSISADQSCKFWSLTNEQPFPTQNILFQSAATCCLFDHLETNLYVGLSNGILLVVSIKTIV
jgi:WD40 repeat protein